MSDTPTISSTGTAPTLATTHVLNGRWRRIGDSIERVIYYSQSSSAGAVDGTGFYLFCLPGSLTVNGSALASNSTGNTDDNNSVGSSISYGSTTILNTSCVRFVYQGTYGVGTELSGTGGTAGVADNNTIVYYVHFTIPVTGWTATNG
jgi:hypothetical protein